jgi:hypothetical protein
VSCKRGRAEGHEDGEDHGHGKRAGDCDTLGIHACFSTEALVLLFSTPSAPAHGSPAHDRLPCALLHADIVATLRNGDTVIATFGGHDHDGERGGDDDSQGKGGGDREGAVSARVMPNPLNPATQVSFTTARDGQVHVAVYDMQGRLVKRLLDEYRAAGAQVLTWDGTSESSGRVPSGVYFLRIQAPEGMGLRRVVVVR